MEFDIYSIGDARFLAETLRATSNILSRGDMTMLVAIALLIGFIWVVVQGVLGGGKEIKFQNVLIAWIMYAVFFGVKAERVNIWAVDNLTVHQVDEVPMGLAFGGMVINRIGVTMARWFDQEYSTPNGSEGFVPGAYGTNTALQALYTMRGLEFNQEDVPLYLRQSLGNYFKECYAISTIIPSRVEGNREIKTNSVEDLRKASYVWPAMRWNNNVYQTTVVYPTGPTQTEEETLGCGDAYDAITDRVLTPAFESNTLVAVAHKGLCKVSDALCTDVSDPSGAPNYASTEVAYRGMVESIVGASLDLDRGLINRIVLATAVAAYRDGSLPTGNVALNTVLQEASSKMTLTQSLQASMFERIMRPLMTFFEALMFVSAPFMALLLALGAGGLMMIGKYLQFAFWIQLWHPVFAVSSMFVQMGIQGTFDRLRQINGGIPLDISTLQNSPMFFDEVAHWISTGSMLQSATPAVTLMLMYGTSVTASSLASKFDTSRFADAGLESLSGSEQVGTTTGKLTDEGFTAIGMDPVRNPEQGTFGASGQAAATLSKAQQQVTASQQKYDRTTDAVNSAVSGLSWNSGVGRTASAEATSRAERSAQWADTEAQRFATSEGWSESQSNGLTTALGYEAGLGIGLSGGSGKNGAFAGTLAKIGKMGMPGRFVAAAAGLLQADIKGKYSNGENFNELIQDTEQVSKAAEAIWQNTKTDREANGIGFSRGNENFLNLSAQLGNVVQTSERHANSATELAEARENLQYAQTNALMTSISSAHEMPQLTAAMTDPDRQQQLGQFLATKQLSDDSYNGIQATPQGFVDALTNAAQSGNVGDVRSLLTIAGKDMPQNNIPSSLPENVSTAPQADLQAIEQGFKTQQKMEAVEKMGEFTGTNVSMPTMPDMREQASLGGISGGGVNQDAQQANENADYLYREFKGTSAEDNADPWLRVPDLVGDMISDAFVSEVEGTTPNSSTSGGGSQSRSTQETTGQDSSGNIITGDSNK